MHATMSNYSPRSSTYHHSREDDEHHAAPYHDFLPPPPPLLPIPAPEEQRQVSNVNERCVITPTNFGTVAQVTTEDVLCGRGAPNIYHPGNQYFRTLVRDRQRDYTLLRRPDKGLVIREILRAVEDHGGRFLRQMAGGEWVEVHDSIAYEKTAQALREFQKTRNKSKAASRK